MVKLLNPHSMTSPIAEEWFCESESELSEIPVSAPPGSIAEILTSEGLTIKMKNSQGEWIEI